MKKLALQIVSLHVDTFQVDAALAGLRGAAQGARSADGVGMPQVVPVPLPSPADQPRLRTL